MAWKITIGRGALSPRGRLPLGPRRDVSEQTTDTVNRQAVPAVSRRMTGALAR